MGSHQSKMVKMLSSLALLGTLSIATAKAQEPLATAGIGLQVCAKLTPAMKPSEGLNNQANYLVFYWVQGYMSAANITTLEGDGEYIDLAKQSDDVIIPLVFDFCTKNPDKKPITVIDELLTNAPKITAQWPKGTIPWAAE